MSSAKCPDCGAKMVQLLFSVVCADACEKRAKVEPPADPYIGCTINGKPIVAYKGTSVWVNPPIVRSVSFNLWARWTGLPMTGVEGKNVFVSVSYIFPGPHTKIFMGSDLNWFEIGLGVYNMDVPRDTDHFAVAADGCQYQVVQLQSRP